MLELNQIYNVDCLGERGMCLIPNKSVDLIVIDPPYNISKDKRWDKWKTVGSYVEWMGNVFKECERVLKDNGSFYFFHNDFLQIVELQKWIGDHTRFLFNSFVVWDKGDFRALAWKNPSEANNLRSWFNTCEYCLFYTFQDETGLEFIDKEYVAPRNPFRHELIRAREEMGMTIKRVAELGEFYGNVNHGGAVTNWEKGYNVPLPEQWEKLKSFLPIRREYEKLRREYEELRREYEESRYTHKLDKHHNNVWRMPSNNHGTLHPTQKPVQMVERIIRTSSNEGAVVLDCFMGSGTTAQACINTRRNFIGFEKDSEYHRIATERIACVQSALFV